MIHISKQRTAIIQMLVCAALWSIAGIFIKLIPWNAFVIAGFRSLFAAFSMIVYMMIRKIKFVINKNVLISGIILCATFLAFVSSNKLTTAANAIVLQFTSPVFVLIFSALFFHRKIKVTDIFAVILTIFGISLFFFGEFDGGKLIGNIIAVLAGACMAGMFLAIGEKNSENERMSGILLGHIFTTLAGIPLLLVFPTKFSLSSVTCVFILGVFQLGIPYMLFALAVEHCPPFACSLLSAVEPLLNPIWVFLFAGEKPSLLALVGGVIVILTVTGWCVLQDRIAKKLTAKQI